MRIELNGLPRDVANGATIADLLGELDVKEPFVAVEVNLQVVPRSRHRETILREGDHLEIVTLVGGG